MNKLQSGPPGQWQKSNCGLFFCRNNFNLRGCAGVAAIGGTRRAHNCIPVKSNLLLADSNYITWAPSVPCCLLLRPPVSRLGILQTLPSKTKGLQNFHSQSPSALTRVPTTLAFFNGVSEAWSLCAFLQGALSHMKPRGSLAATVLTEGKTLPEGSADLENCCKAASDADATKMKCVWRTCTFHVSVGGSWPWSLGSPRLRKRQATPQSGTSNKAT